MCAMNSDGHAVAQVNIYYVVIILVSKFAKNKSVALQATCKMLLLMKLLLKSGSSSLFSPSFSKIISLSQLLFK